MIGYFEMWNNDIFEVMVNVDIDDWFDDMGDDFDLLLKLGGS